jgi:hypothetical protein
MAAQEKERQERAIAGSVGNEMFRSLPINQQAEIRSDLETAKLYLQLDEIQDYNSIPFMKNKGIADKTQLQEWADAVAKSNGLTVDLPEVSETGETEEERGILGWLFDSPMRKRLLGDDNETAQPTQQATPTLVQPTQTDTEPPPPSSAPPEKPSNETERMVNGRPAIFDAETKQFIRWGDQ